MGILNFKEFSINEKVGVAESTLYYVDAIYEKTWEEFRKFHTSGEKSLEETVSIGYRKFFRKIKDREVYAEFPVVSISLNLDFKKQTPETFNKKHKFASKIKKKHSVGGWANRFGHKNWGGYSQIKDPIKTVTDHGIVIDLGIEIVVSSDFNIGTYWKKLTDDIYETIWHELNHVYEFYKRVQSGGGPIWTRAPRLAVTFADTNRWNITKGIYEYWQNNFTYYLYTSEPYELNAQVQEVGYQVSKYGIKSIYKTLAWENANKMENFDADEFIIGLENIITKKGKDVRTTKENLKKMWVNLYIKTLTDEKESPTIDHILVSKMNCDEFVRYMGKRLNRAGKYLKSKIGKLYELDPINRVDSKPDKIADYYKSKGVNQVIAKDTGTEDEEVY